MMFAKIMKMFNANEFYLNLKIAYLNTTSFSLLINENKRFLEI